MDLDLNFIATMTFGHELNSSLGCNQKRWDFFDKRIFTLKLRKQNKIKSRVLHSLENIDFLVRQLVASQFIDGSLNKCLLGSHEALHQAQTPQR
jgi:hypothetical protein